MSTLGVIGAAVNAVNHVVENLNVTGGVADVDAGGKAAAVVPASEVTDPEIPDGDVAAILDLEETDGEAIVAGRIDAVAVDDGVFAREALEGDVAGGRRT